MTFAEQLPAQCPPPEAAEEDLLGVYRLVRVNPVPLSEFASYVAIGKAPVGLAPDQECRYASCSLTTDPKMLKKLSKLKHRFAAKLDLPASAGQNLKRGIHIDFWRYANFDIVGAICAIEDV